jgi:metal-responsive CopG/Arc/MetJ family transcriptional regulator
MKVAVSIPDDVFEKADRLAREMKKSRSELYATALNEYLCVRDAEAVREKLDAVYSQDPGRVDPSFARAQSEVLDDETW